MDDQSKADPPTGENQPYSVVIRSLALVIILLVLYVLSIGPVARLYCPRWPPNLVVEFYDPVFKYCPARFLEFYIYEVWGLTPRTRWRSVKQSNLRAVTAGSKPDRPLLFYLGTPEPSPTPPINLKTNRSRLPAK